MKKTEPLDACGVKGCKRPDRPSSVFAVSLEIGSSALQDAPPVFISAPGGLPVRLPAGRQGRQATSPQGFSYARCDP